MGNAPSIVPASSQLNYIKTNVSCVTGFYFDLSTTAPLAGGSGQVVTLSDIRGSIAVLPFNDPIDFPHWGWNLTFDLVSDNASPSVVHIAQSGYQPCTNGTFAFTNPPIPLTLGSPGQNNVRIANLNVTITNYGPDETYPGFVQLVTPLSCLGPDSPYILTSTAINLSTGPAMTPSNNGASRFPELAPGTKYTVAQLPTSCALSIGSSNIEFPLQIGASTPANLTAGQGFNLSTANTFVTIQAGFVSALSSFYGGDHAYIEIKLGSHYSDQPRAGAAIGLSTSTGEVLDVSANSTNVGTDAPRPIGVIREVSAGDNNPLPMPLPVHGAFDIGLFTAGASGTIFSINNSTFGGYLAGYSQNGLLAGYFDFDCIITTPFNIFSIPVM